jgi:hypothetical protein
MATVPRRAQLGDRGTAVSCKRRSSPTSSPFGIRVPGAHLGARGRKVFGTGNRRPPRPRHRPARQAVCADARTDLSPVAFTSLPRLGGHRVLGHWGTPIGRQSYRRFRWPLVGEGMASRHWASVWWTEISTSTASPVVRVRWASRSQII